MKDKPYIDGFQWRSIESNSTGLLIMLKGEADWAWISVPDPLNTWVAKNTDNKFFSPQIAYNYLFLNTQKYPLNNPMFRRAISLAIDRESINQKAYYDIGGIANAAGIIPDQQKEWLDPTLQTLAASLSNYNPLEAEKILEQLGYKKDPSTGMLLNPNGTPLAPLEITVAAGYTDYITASQIISYNLKQIGIPTTVNQESPGAWYNSLLTGQYDMSFTWTGSTLGPTPYYMYYHLFSPQFSAPTGKIAMSNWSRYTNPLITDALEIYTTNTNLRLQQQAMYTIERVILDDMPIIPLVGAPMWNFYSTRNFVGWPSESNDYNPSSVSNPPLMEQVLLNVHLK
jgi:peptide/nickel transport system substrate-binding protein